MAIGKKVEQSALNIANYDKDFNKAKESKDPKDMTTLILMGHMMKTYKFGLVETGTGAKPLAVYDKKRGIYVIDEDYIESLIFNEYQDLRTAQYKEVYQKIAWQCAAQEPLRLTHDRNLIPVSNGIYDLKKHELKPFSQDYVFMSKVSTDYVKDAKEPEINGWKPSEWLKSLAMGDDQVTTLLWQVIQASLNGSFSYRKSIWLKGIGNDGKGTYEKLIMNIVGPDNVASLKANEFKERFAMSALVGKTVVIGDDVPAGVFLDDSSNFNSVVTGDVVTVDVKNRQAYSIVLTPTIIQSTNEMPRFKNNTNGTFRRLVIVPFNHHFEPGEDNHHIKDDYIGRTDVVQWFMKTALDEYNFDEFIEPDATKVAMKEFKEDNDPLANFKIEVFDEHEPEVIPVGAVYVYYVQYQKDNGQRNIMTQRKFTKQFGELIADDYDRKSYRLKDNSWKFEEFTRGNNSEVGQKLLQYENSEKPKCYVRISVPKHLNQFK